MAKKPPPPVFRDDTDATITSLFRKGYDSFRIAKMLGLAENRVLRITRALELQKKAHPETFVKTTADREYRCLNCADTGKIKRPDGLGYAYDPCKACELRRGVSPDGPASRNEKKIPKG